MQLLSVLKSGVTAVKIYFYYITNWKSTISKCIGADYKGDAVGFCLYVVM